MLAKDGDYWPKANRFVTVMDSGIHIMISGLRLSADLICFEETKYLDFENEIMHILGLGDGVKNHDPTRN